MARNNEHKFKLNNEEYHLTWIDKPRITKNGIKQKVLPVLREYIITENLAIQLVNNNGNKEVPHTLARKVLGYFSNENKVIDKNEGDLTSHKITSKSFALVNKKSTMDINISVDQKIEELLKKLDWNKIQDKNKKKLLIIGCSHSKNGGGQVNDEQNYFAHQNELIQNRNIRFDQYSELLLNNQDYFDNEVDYYTNLFHNNSYLPAINRYKGRFYSEALKQLYLEKNENANLHILIISGLYGVIDFRDSIIDYHLEIKKNPFWTLQNNHTINEAVTNYIDEHQIDNDMVYYSLSQSGNHSYLNALKPLNDWKNIWISHGRGASSVRFLRDQFLPEM